MLAWTVSGASIFVVATGAILWWLGSRDESYQAGDPVEGLTNLLSRDIPEDYPRVRFENVAAEAGITFRHFFGTRSTKLPEDMGSGAAWGDFDRDGWVDLFVVNQAGPLTPDGAGVEGSPARAALYRNLGDGTFEEVAERVGVDFRGQGMGARWGDVDNDGWPDLLVTGYNDLRLYRNSGDGTFADVTVSAGLETDAGFWTGAAWGDYDRDGLLDLYVTGYVQFDDTDGEEMASQYDVDVPTSLNPSSFEAARNLLFHNEGGFRFSERAESAGVTDPRGRGLAAVWLDVDEDGWPDIYVANDVSDNALFRNNGDGTFEEISYRALVADYRGAMGIAVGDWDGDLDQDFFITHWIAQENALYSSILNQLSLPEDGPDRPIQFRDDADRFGLGQIALDFVGWGTSFLDIDNDGLLDLLVVNGSTFQEDDDPTLLVPMRDQIFWNAGRQRGFFDISPALGPYFQEEHVGRGLAVADYDRDGDLDAFIVQHAGDGVLLRNEGNEGAWLQVELEGRTSNRDAIGARLVVYAAGAYAAAARQMSVVGAQSPYLSQNSRTLHFGLGAASAYDSLVVTWPTGVRESWGGGNTGRRVRIVEGQSDVEVVARAEVLSEREEVERFWGVLRQATADRIAGRLEDAHAGYLRVTSLNPVHKDGLYYLGQVSLDLNRPVEAWDAWERLIAVDPRSSRGFLALAKLGICGSPEIPFDAELARDRGATAFDINAQEVGPLLVLAMASVASSDWEEADRWLDAVLTWNTLNVSSIYLKGYVAWVRGERDAAAAFYADALVAMKGPEKGPEASGEGDTKLGQKPLTVSAQRCEPLGGPWIGITEGSSAEDSYVAFRRWLDERRPS